MPAEQCLRHFCVYIAETDSGCEKQGKPLRSSAAVDCTWDEKVALAGRLLMASTIL